MTSDRQPDFISRQVREGRYFYLNLHPRPGKTMVVGHGGCERCAADYSISRSRLHVHTIEYVADGAGELVLHGRRHVLVAGAVFYYGPRTPHHIHTDPHNPLLKYFLGFTGRQATRLLAGTILGRTGFAYVTTPNEVFDLFEQVLLNGASKTRHSPALCATLLQALLLKLAERGIGAEARNTRALATYQRARACLDEHFATIRNLTDLAQQCRVEKSYLCRLFQQYDHVTPERYLLRLKMNRAAALLTASPRLIKEAAEEVGFADPYHFSRVFRRLYGVSPSRFAHRERQDIKRAPHASRVAARRDGR